MKTSKLTKLKRTLGVKNTDDPDGVLAVLQIARRLVSEGDSAVYATLDDAIQLASPKDHALAWWAAHRALFSSLPSGFRTLGEFTHEADKEDLLKVFDRAINKQGTMNAAVRKGKWNK